MELRSRQVKEGPASKEGDNTDDERDPREHDSGGPYGDYGGEKEFSPWMCWWAAEQRKMVAMLAEEQRRLVGEVTGKMAEMAVRGESRYPEMAPRFKLTRMQPTDDPEAFLHAFERVATMARWPKEQWSAILTPFLTGDAQTAVDTLPLHEAEDYDRVKRTILGALHVSEEAYRLRFRETVYQRGKGARALGNHVRSLGLRWLRPEEKEPEEVVEAVWIEQFLHALPLEARQWVQCQKPANLEEAVTAMETYETAHRTTWKGSKHVDAEGGATAIGGKDSRKEEMAERIRKGPTGGAECERSGLSPSGRGRAVLQEEASGTVENRAPIGRFRERGDPRERTPGVAPPRGHPMIPRWTEDLVCFRCGIRGHVRRECRQRGGERDSMDAITGTTSPGPCMGRSEGERKKW